MTAAAGSHRTKRRDRNAGWETEKWDDELRYKRRKSATEGVSIPEKEPIKPYSGEEANAFLPSKKSLKLEGLTEEEQLYKLCDAICRSVYESVTSSNAQHASCCLSVNNFLTSFLNQVYALRERKVSPSFEADCGSIPVKAVLVQSRASRKEALLELKSRAEAEERRLVELHERMKMRFAMEAVCDAQEENKREEVSPDLSDAMYTARALASDLREKLLRANQVLKAVDHKVRGPLEYLEGLCEKAEEIADKLSKQLHCQKFQLYPDLTSPRQLIQTFMAEL